MKVGDSFVASYEEVDRIRSAAAYFATRNPEFAFTTRGVAPLDSEAAYMWLDELEGFYNRAQGLYESGLTAGVPKELARLVLPVARYSRMRASANLRNWLAFLTLRKSPKAQWEIRQYADAVGALVAEHFPRTWALFEKENSYGGE